MRSRLKSKVLLCVLSASALFSITGNVMASKPLKGFRLPVTATLGRLPIFASKRRKILFHDAAKRGDIDGVRLCAMLGEDVNAVDDDGYTPLMRAAEKGRLEVVTYLCENGANINAVNKSDYSLNPLTYAALSEKWDVVKYLVKRPGINVNYVSEDVEGCGNTALAFACGAGNLEMVKFLIASGANANMHSGDSFNALEYAAAKDKENVVSYLVDEAHVEFDPTHLLGIASEHSAEGVARYCVDNGARVREVSGVMNSFTKHEKLDIMVYLIANGADVNSSDALGRTALHLAAERGEALVAEYLVFYGADVNAVDRAGQTPLHLAAKNGKEDVAKYLAQHGAKVNLRDRNGQTPLHLAAEIGNAEIVKCLVIDRGADVYINDDKGQTPLDLAEERAFSIRVAGPEQYMVTSSASLFLRGSDGFKLWNEDQAREAYTYALGKYRDVVAFLSAR